MTAWTRPFVVAFSFLAELALLPVSSARALWKSRAELAATFRRKFSFLTLAGGRPLAEALLALGLLALAFLPWLEYSFSAFDGPIGLSAEYSFSFCLLCLALAGTHYLIPSGGAVEWLPRLQTGLSLAIVGLYILTILWPDVFLCGFVDPREYRVDWPYYAFGAGATVQVLLRLWGNLRQN